MDRACHPVACICTTLYLGYLQKFSFFVNFSPTFIFRLCGYSTSSSGLLLYFTVLRVFTEVQFFCQLFANFHLSAMWIEHVIQWLVSVPYYTSGIYRSSVFFWPTFNFQLRII